MRLRPSGNSGPLVASLTAFEKYQRESAWTWEHQALVRARPVAGDASLQAAFNQMRLNILCQARDLTKLNDEVRSMRAKMRSQLGSKKRPGGGLIQPSSRMRAVSWTLNLWFNT